MRFSKIRVWVGTSYVVILLRKRPGRVGRLVLKWTSCHHVDVGLVIVECVCVGIMWASAILTWMLVLRWSDEADIHYILLDLTKSCLCSLIVVKLSGKCDILSG